MNNKKNIVDRLTMFFTRISSVVLLILIIIMVVNVIGRRLFNAPISGTIELVEYGMLVCIALAISRTGFEGRQLSVTMVQELLPAKARAIVKCICNAVAGALFGSLIFKFISVLPSAISSGRVSDVL
ncbi:MAG: TRAP transporter small permease, partial [Oscillospiraceae bacterium]|nr:TRAP transporter small permease [Oscillospiraceae bacterium]